MKLVIVRHGDPDYEKDSLTEKGWREAEALVRRIEGLNATKFYCSPLGRARDTAAPTLKKLGREAETLDWLREFPAYVTNSKTGERVITWDQLPSCWTAEEKYFDREKWLDTDLMNSGNTAALYKSVCEKLDKLLEDFGYKHVGNSYRVMRESSDTVVMFCHFGIECVLLSHILKISPMILWHNFVALPSSVTTLITEEREKGIAVFRCNGFGDISHLYADGQQPSFAARFCEKYSNEDERH